MDISPLVVPTLSEISKTKVSWGALGSPDFMDIWILGCGPSLDDVEIPPNVLTIGTNDTYLKYWSPIYVTTDANALRRDYPENKAQAIIHYTAINPERPIPPIDRIAGRPLESIYKPERCSLRKSGAFAAWVAVNCFKATRLHFIGFDMEISRGHFKDALTRVGWERTYTAQRERLADICKDIEAHIWIKDRFVPVSVLPVIIREALPGHTAPRFDKRHFVRIPLPANKRK